MPDVTTQKDVGGKAGLAILSAKASYEYPSEAIGATNGYGSDSNLLAIHLSGSPDTTEADNMLTAIASPTCVASGLDVTTNVGTYVVDDSYTATADPTETKFVLMSVLIDDTTGVFEVYAFTKTAGFYGSIPAGKTLASDLREFSIEAAGSTMTITRDFL